MTNATGAAELRSDALVSKQSQTAAFQLQFFGKALHKSGRFVRLLS